MIWPGRWGTEAQGTHCREGEAGHNVSLGGTMGDTRRSQTISTESQGIARQAACKLFAGQQSYAPNGVSPVWFAIGLQPLATEEPYEGNLHVRICGEGAG